MVIQMAELVFNSIIEPEYKISHSKHQKTRPNVPSSEETNYRTRHPKLPAAIHPIPPPNGQEKGGINYYYYSRP